ncbi:cupin domain-containing protein [Halosolutus amylolyticus]|uniref:Cupin domain-containing protein n=1 Tax=Halosolutus amylolyticus TaxID=2932267 RepID=A0ABD5PW91_9EURY|nr:cupin domain-containing protein [Halosolutus amylolyticus]
MHKLVNIDGVEPLDLEDVDPSLLPIGPELEPDRMRPSVWEYERGAENTFHRQAEQEELYVVLEGTLEVTIERDDERDVVELTVNDVLVVPPGAWRQLKAIEDSRVLVVGAPNVADDAITETEE